MVIILARHGNTFNPWDKVYRVGSRNDLPLVSQGVIQSEKFASALINKKITPCAVYCSPLIRTRQFSNIIINKMDLPISPKIDIRLNELDYGDWAGLTDKEIASKFAQDLKMWKALSQWPEKSNWPETEQYVIQSTVAFTRELVMRHGTDDIVLVVSSCGRMRYFLKLIDGEFEANLQGGGVTVKTGNACKIVYQNEKFKVEAWNVNPDEL